MRMSTICLILLAVFTSLTVAEGAYFKDYPAMFATGTCAVIFLGVLLVLLEMEGLAEEIRGRS